MGGLSSMARRDMGMGWNGTEWSISYLSTQRVQNCSKVYPRMEDPSSMDRDMAS